MLFDPVDVRMGMGRYEVLVVDSSVLGKTETGRFFRECFFRRTESRQGGCRRNESH